MDNNTKSSGLQWVVVRAAKGKMNWVLGKDRYLHYGASVNHRVKIDQEVEVPHQVDTELGIKIFPQVNVRNSIMTYRTQKAALKEANSKYNRYKMKVMELQEYNDMILAMEPI